MDGRHVSLSRVFHLGNAPAILGNDCTMNQLAAVYAKLERTMPANRHKPDLWKADIAKSVDMFNEWFLHFAPKTFRESRNAGDLRGCICFGADRVSEESEPRDACLSSGVPAGPANDDMSTHCTRQVDRFGGGFPKPCTRAWRLSTRFRGKWLTTTLQQGLAKIAQILRRLADTDILVWLETETGAERGRG